MVENSKSIVLKWYANACNSINEKRFSDRNRLESLNKFSVTILH